MTNTNTELWPGWEVIRVAGRGSFGTVYEIGRQIGGNTERAALKVITVPRDPDELEALYCEGYDAEAVRRHYADLREHILREYRIMLRMKGHPNVVTCEDIRCVPHDDGVGWDICIKMELLTSLRKVVNAEFLAYKEPQVLRLARDLCSALAACRKQNILHRDVKPENIFLSDMGTYKLGDFGVAKISERTETGTRAGTGAYMAPEVAFGRAYGASADVYSLGLVLYWLMNERTLPFLPVGRIPTADEIDTARKRRLAGQALPMPLHGSQGLRRIVEKACAYDPKDRYADAEAMLWDLERLQRPVQDAPRRDEAERCFCQKCGAPVEKMARFCDNCGMARFFDPASDLPEAPGPEKPRIWPEEPRGSSVEKEPPEEAEPLRPAPRRGRQIAVAGICVIAVLAVILLLIPHGWKTVDGQTVYYRMGVKATGWQTVDGQQYYFDGNGVMQTGWCKVDGQTYLLSSAGAMCTGWQSRDGSRYYFDANGVLQTGTLSLDGSEYYLGSDGAMRAGWQDVNGEHRYYGTDGVYIETVAVYVCLDPYGVTYFFTADPDERDDLLRQGWDDRGIGWYAPVQSDTPVFRMRENATGVRIYMTGEAERDSLESAGWVSEGIAWYSADKTEGSPVYGLYQNDIHYYTCSIEERDSFTARYWIYDGVGWYGIPEE